MHLRLLDCVAAPDRLGPESLGACRKCSTSRHPVRIDDLASETGLLIDGRHGRHERDGASVGGVVRARRSTSDGAVASDINSDMFVSDICVAILSRRRNAVGVVLAGFAFFVAACSGGGSEDVDAAIGAAIAEHTQAHDTEIVSASEIAEMVRDEIREEADASSRTSDSSPGGGEDPAPREADPAGYTRYVVGSAMAMYDAEGLDATLAYYNDSASVDGQWYVFIVDSGGELIGHYDPARVARSCMRR